MLDIPLDRDLENRLRQVAARLGRSPQDCAASAIRSFVADCEEAFAHGQRLGGEGVMRPPEGFYD
ncbi:MAG: hypothetical protein HYU59_08360 [Magnetospirillum gryphiswaldense]|nr:hypothetical protein [Magnetospirillum gryphiswaldense]